jgi:ferritin
MNTNRLSKTLSAAFNAQMTNEAHASQQFLAYASWADSRVFSGVANFLFRHAQEKRNHMMKILQYILKRGTEVHIEVIPAPGNIPSSLHGCFELIFQDEVENTQAVYSLVALSLEEKDWSTWNFMQWFVQEQIEEETLAMNLLDKLKIAGGEKASSDILYSLDRDLEKTPDTAKSALDVSAENP